MREIKFRYVIKNDEGKEIVVDDPFDVYFTLDGELYIVDHDIIEAKMLRYTGLKDKNGLEIFKGDIVKYTRYIYTDCSRKEIEYKEEPVIGEIYYAEGIWLGIRFKDGTGWIFNPGTISTSKNNKELEVIGNIYEKPELLV